jgi:hypothetical protein
LGAILSSDNTYKGFTLDVKLGETIDYFDPALSYELTHYRPINDTDGLDFNPD